MKKRYGFLTLIFSVILLTGVNVNAQSVPESYFDKNKREVVCSEPLPVFTLGENSNPKTEQVKTLCLCTWNTFPADGWERRTAQMIKNNQDPGWRGKAFISRFSDALKSCGGMNL